jgi:hypothetical protein
MPKETKSTKSQSTPRKKTERKPPAPASGAPLIDPLQSAATAAALVGHKIAPPAPVTGAKTESSTFRNLKDSVTKPHSQTIGGVLDKIAPNTQKWSGAHAGSGKQVGHNQTFGPDAARKNVPRRTNG